MEIPTAPGHAGGAGKNDAGPAPSGQAYFVTDEQPCNLQTFMDGVLDGLGKSASQGGTIPICMVCGGGEQYMKNNRSVVHRPFDMAACRTVLDLSAVPVSRYS